MATYVKYTNELIYDIYQIYTRNGAIGIRKGMIEVSEINGKEHREFVEDGGNYRKRLYEDDSYHRYAKEDELIDVLTECISSKEKSIETQKKIIQTIEDSISVLKEMRDKLSNGADIKTIIHTDSSLNKNKIEWARQKKHEGYTIPEIAKALHVPIPLISAELKGIKKDNKREPLIYEEITG